MGLMASEGEQGIEQWELVADTGSLEEDLGPMQLHAAGTSGGFTALQLVCNRSGNLTCVLCLWSDRNRLLSCPAIECCTENLRKCCT